jgi:diguanylate cyclase (GGDEF)-like protein/PAS domain S-box-containing protein
MSVSRAKILLCEHDLSTLEAGVALLNLAGYQVLSVSTAVELFDLYKREKPNLLVLDASLPGEGSAEIIRALRATDGGMQLRILLVSDPGSELVPGADDRIARPFAGHELLARIEMHLRVQAADLALAESAARFQSLLDNLPAPVWVVDGKGARIFVNRAWLEYTGRHAETVLGQAWMEDLHPEDIHRYGDEIKTAWLDHQPFSLDVRIRRRDGSYGWLREQAAPRFDRSGVFDGYLTVCQDIEDTQHLREELNTLKASLAVADTGLRATVMEMSKTRHVDHLTGVNNRQYLFDRASTDVARSLRYRQPVALMIFNLDRFKLFNQILGNTVGDQILQRVAQAAYAELRGADLIGRIGSDDFGILLPMTTAQNSLIPAERIRAAVEALFISVPFDNETVTLTISIGIDELILAGQFSVPDTTDELFQRATEAMQLAKQAGRNKVMLHPRLR